MALLTNLVIVLVLIAFAIMIGAIMTKGFTKVDAFQNGRLRAIQVGDEIPVTQDAGADPWTKPYTTQPIQKVDDYEHDVVFNNEGDRQYSDAEINAKVAARPFEWPGLPPSAAKFQEKQAQWMVDISKAEPVRESKYVAIEGFSVMPLDYDGIEAEEKKLLQTYVPACSKDLKYDVDDAKDLIDKIYKKKGLSAMVDIRDDGVYEVYETKELNPKIEYEDDAEAATERMAPADIQSAKFEVPQAAGDLAAGLDPFFEPGPRTRAGRNDYQAWTPGLERSFAPNQARTNWY